MKRWYQHDSYNVPILRLMFRVLTPWPRFAQPPLAALVALFFCLKLKRERLAVTNNLRQITQSRGLTLFWRVYRVFYSFSDLMVSYCFIPKATHQQLIEMLVEKDYGAGIIEEHLAAGKGLILWTAHIGNPEFASRLLELHGRPVNVARVVEDNPAEMMLRELMKNDLLRVVDLRAGGAATIELLKALRRNEIVAIQGDRVYHSRHSATIPFFSRPASFPLGPFLLSQVSGAPVIPGFVVRDGWLRYRMVGGAPILPNTTGDLDQNRHAALEQAVRFLEEQLSIHYDQWINFYDFWQTSP